MIDNNNTNHINKSNISLIPKRPISSNRSTVNLNNNLTDFYIEEFKNIFKKYLSNQHRKQNQPNDDTNSETESTGSNGEIYNELNNIYLKSFKNLNQFLKEDDNLKGVRLQGNKLLENISLEQFNEFFSQYGKGIEKKLKKQVLNYFYPNNNKHKLMGQKMHLTPIPIKKQIYLKNEAGKNNYKNAERAAVIMRRLEYTHGLGNKRNNEEKIYFYLLKGAALIIEEWWLKILKKRRELNLENKNRSNNESNIVNKKVNNDNNNEKQNKDIYQFRPKTIKRAFSSSLYNNNYNLNNSNKNQYQSRKPFSSKIKKNNNIELIKLNSKKNVIKNINNDINDIKKNKNKSPNKTKINYNLSEKKNRHLLPNYLINQQTTPKNLLNVINNQNSTNRIKKQSKPIIKNSKNSSFNLNKTSA